MASWSTWPWLRSIPRTDADFELFDKHGEIHIILCRPYGPDDWRAYAHDGLPTYLEVVG